MANYRSVHVKFWSDPDVETLSPTAKFLFIYLITNPHRNESALYSLTLRKIAFETGLVDEQVRDAMSELDSLRRIVYDLTTQTVWVINAVKHQTLNKNCITSIMQDVARCASPDLATRFCAHYNDFGDLGVACKEFVNRSVTVSEPLTDGFETPSSGLPNPPIGTGTGTGTGRKGDARGKPTKRDEFDHDVAQLTVPEALRSAEFDEWWLKWIEHRYTKPKPKSWQKLLQDQLDLLAEYGSDDAVYVLRKSTTNGYTGLVDPPRHAAHQHTPGKREQSSHEKRLRGVDADAVRERLERISRGDLGGVAGAHATGGDPDTRGRTPVASDSG